MISSTEVRKPRKLFDYSHYENLIDELLELEAKKADYIFAKIYYDDLVVIYCGKYVRYGRIIPNKKKTKKASSDVMDFIIQPFSKKSILQDINLFFAKTVEVVKLIETCVKN